MNNKAYRKILIATDGSENAQKAVESGMELARVSSAGVHAMYVMEMDKVGVTLESAHSSWKAAMELAATEQITMQQWHDIGRMADKACKNERRKHLTQAAIQATSYVENMGKEMGVEVETVIVEGDAANEILDHAEKNRVDLVVIGALGMSADGRYLLGSVAEKVIRNSPVEVLSVR
ncbi:MAG: universal stress protein [Euryarchaeota archaeon]|nr:universal stress protein [Euryarchaeota archaeon]